MNEPIISFRKNMESIKALHALHKHLCTLLPAMDLTEILRAEIVLVVSAFDCFIHDIVKYGIIDIFKDQRRENSKYDNICIPISIVKQILTTDKESERNELLEISIKKILSKDSYQSPKSIENALQLISITKIWSSIKDEMHMSPTDITKKLGVIINRRNKIAHESDIKNHIDISKNEIEREDIDDIINFISSLTESINNQYRTHYTDQ